MWGKGGGLQLIYRKKRHVVLQSADWLYSSDRIFQNGKGGAAWIALSDFYLSCVSLREKTRSPLVVVIHSIGRGGHLGSG